MGTARALLLGVLLAAPCAATPTILVLPPGAGALPPDRQAGVFRDLQEAVDAAPDGATLLLAPGEHVLRPAPCDDPSCGNCTDPATPVRATCGLLVRGKSLRIAGAGGGESVIRTGAGYGIVFDRSRRSVLEGITVTGGIRDPDGNATDAAVLVRGSRVAIRGCRIVENRGDRAVVDRTVVGIIGIAGREGAVIEAEGNEIAGNSWDGVALYRGARAVLTGNRIDGGPPAAEGEVPGGRGVAVGSTWDARAVLRRNWIARYWKGVGAFVDGRVDARGNVIEDLRTWGIALWEGTGEGRPVLEARGNVVHGTGACGVSVARSGPGPPAPGFLSGNVLVATGQDARYDGGEPYCFQTAIARHSVPEGFRIGGNILHGNREPGGTPGAGDLSAEEFAREAAPLCRRLRRDTLLSRTRFARERCGSPGPPGEPGN